MKIGVHPTGTDPDNFIHAMPAYLRTAGVCRLKWVAGFPRNPQRGLPNVTGIQVCNDVDTGLPLAVMDCAWLTGLRTAAVSTVIAADRFIVDDIPLAEYFQKISVGRRNDRGEETPEFSGGIPPVYATIGEIVSGERSGRDDPMQRIVAIPIGMAICDIALGDLVYRKAREAGVGQEFALS